MTDRTLELIVEARLNFYRRWHSPEVERMFLTNEMRILDMFDNANISNIFSRISTLPISMFNYTETPIPNATQLSIGLLPATDVNGSPCSICQEPLTDAGACVRLRNCSHTFHRACANRWYRISACCPLCRNDIRTAPASNTNG